MDLTGLIDPKYAADILSPDKHICPHCGRLVPKQTYTVMGREVTVQPICKCEADEDDRRKREMEIRERKSEIESRYSALRSSPKYRGCSLSNFEVTPANKSAYQAARDFVASWPDSKDLLIYGNPGNGKSHLAAAIGNALAADDVIVVFAAYVDLLEAIKSTYNGGEGNEAEILGAICRADLLVLDDLGVERPSEYTLDVLFRIAERRGRSYRKTVYTTNYSPKELAARYTNAVGGIEAQRVIGRIVEGATVVKNGGEDRRLQQ